MAERERESNAGLMGLLAVGLGACCGLPLLASAGVFGAAAGVGLGSWLIVAVGASAVVVGVVRRRQRSARCELPTADDAVDDMTGAVDDRAV